MGLFSFLLKTPDDLARKGQAAFHAKQYAQAVRDYEKALDRHEKNPSLKSDFEKTMLKNISAAKNALAKQHIATAEELFSANCHDDARDLLVLALELTDDHAVEADSQRLLEDIQTARSAMVSEDAHASAPGEMDREEEEFSPEDFHDGEYATALINALPEEEQKAYLEYGIPFMRGFVALNQGDFDRAGDYLAMALKDHGETKTYIPLELATCRLNQGALDEAKDLLETFVQDFPLSLRAYPVLCETLWALKAHDRALEVLAACPEELAGTPLINLLIGETHADAGNHEAAVACYLAYMAQNGREESILRALGNTYQTMGESEKARNVYAELLDACKTCHRPADTDLKKRYADTSFATGQHTIPVLEIYLELAEKEPHHRGEYYQKVSAIYKAMGNDGEAERFAGFSKKTG